MEFHYPTLTVRCNSLAALKFANGFHSNGYNTHQSYQYFTNINQLQKSCKLKSLSQ